MRATGHRPWPIPDRPWVMTQSWHDLLFLHWPFDPAVVRRVVPGALPLDLHDGRAWVGVVPFHMSNVAPRGAGSFALAFPELNVRTYVTLGGKPGVYFFSLDASSRIAVATARALFGLPYFAAAMRVQPRGAAIQYSSRRQGTAAPAEFVARYEPAGQVRAPEAGSLDHFLTERYCLYVVRRGAVRRLEIHHPPWALQPASLDVEVNTMLAAAGIPAPAAEPHARFARRQDAVAWWSERS